MPTQFLPRARQENLIVQRMDDEIILYDTLTNEAHVLNQSAALVWKFSDGKHTIPQLTQLVARELHAQPNTELVELALRQLSRSGLLEQSRASLPATLNFTRREFLQKAALAAMVVPVVKTISAPTTQQANSCSGVGEPCQTAADCCEQIGCDTANHCCFVAGTSILYQDGTRRPIETVTVGDLVLARDEHTGVIAPQRVEKLYVHRERQAFTLNFGAGEIGTTAIHPFYTDSGWVHALDLRAGMDCYLSDGSRLTVRQVEHSSSQPQTVYNLQVANFHTYFVGNQGVWVHNKD